MLKMGTDWGTKRERAVWRFGTLGTGVSGQNCLTMGVSASSSGVWYGGIYGVLWCRLPPWWYGGQCSLSWPLQCELMAAWRTRRKWGGGVSCQLLTSPPHLFTPPNQFEVNFGWNLEQLKELGHTHLHSRILQLKDTFYLRTFGKYAAKLGNQHSISWHAQISPICFQSQSQSCERKEGGENMNNYNVFQRVREKWFGFMSPVTESPITSNAPHTDTTLTLTLTLHSIHSNCTLHWKVHCNQWAFPVDLCVLHWSSHFEGGVLISFMWIWRQVVNGTVTASDWKYWTFFRKCLLIR